MPDPTKQITTKGPSPTELTGPQAIDGGAGGGIVGVHMGTPGFEFSGRKRITYAEARRIRSHPIVTFARALATAPMRAADWSYEHDEGFEQQRDYIREQMTPLREWLLHNALFALDYGWAPFEKVFEVQAWEGRPVLGLRKLKPLLVDKTNILVESSSGSFTGLRQGRIDLLAAQAFVYTYDPEAGDLYGRGRHESIRAEYAADLGLTKRQGQYLTQIIGGKPICHYPPGTSRDASGAEDSGFKRAKEALERLGTGQGIAVPNQLMQYAQDLVKQGVDVSKLRPWQFEILEPKTAHGDEMTNTHKHLESRLMAGWLVPPRSGLEGQYGTKAEAETHADAGLLIADLTLQELIRHVNWYIVDQLLALNWGEATRGHVQIVTAPLQDEAKHRLWALLKAVFSPQNADTLFTMLDADATFEQLGLPKVDDTINEKLGGIDEDKAGVQIEAAIQTGVSAK